MRTGILAIAVALVGALAGEGSAQNVTQGLSSNDIMGRWCTENISYTFTPKQLTVRFADGQQKVLNVAAIRVEGANIVMEWAEDSNTQSAENRGKGSHTTFSQFGGGKMVQITEVQDNGKPTPTRYFRRC